MSERIKSGKARAEAARQELADLHSKYMAKRSEVIQSEKFGAFDDVEPEPGNLTYDQYLAQRPDTPESGVSRTNDGTYRDSATGRFISQGTYLNSQVSSADYYREFMKNNDPEIDITKVKLNDIALKYAQAKLVNDITAANVAINLLDQKIDNYVDQYNMPQHQVDTIRERVMKMAQTIVESSNSLTDYVLLEAQDLIVKYAQAEVSDDQAAAGQALGDIDAVVAAYTSKHNLQKPQVDELYDSIMDRAQTVAQQATEGGKVDDLSDIKVDAEPNEAGDPADIKAADKIDDLADLTVGNSIDTLDSIQDAKPGQIDDLADIELDPKPSQVDDLHDLEDADTSHDKVDDLHDLERGGRIKKIGNLWKDANAKAAAVLSGAMLRAGQWFNKQRAKHGNLDMRQERVGKATVATAVGMLAVGTAIWLWHDKSGGGFNAPDWLTDWWGNNNGHGGSPTVTETPVDSGSSNGAMPGVGQVDPGNSDPVTIPEVDPSDIDTSVDDTPAITTVETVAMPGLDSGSYVYPWDWASDKFGSQNSRKVLNELVRQTDGACWHRLGDGVDTNDWISINGRSDTRYVIEQLSRVANDNPDLVQSMYRG